MGDALTALQQSNDMRKNLNDLHRTGTAAGVMDEGVAKAVEKLRADASALWPEARRTQLLGAGSMAVSATVAQASSFGEAEQVRLQISGPAQSGSGIGHIVIPAVDGRKLAKMVRQVLDDLADLGWVDE